MYADYPKNQAHQGVFILIRKILRKYITPLYYTKKQLPKDIKMNLTIRGHTLTILGIYGLHDESTLRKIFSNKLTTKLRAYDH